MQFGLTIKRPDSSPPPVDSFSSPRPTFSISKDAERLQHTTPPIKDTTPASPIIESVVETIQSTGNNKLAELIAAAEKKAKESARLIERAKSYGNNLPRKSYKKVVEEKVKQDSTPQVLFTDADKCSSHEEFIRRTRNVDFYTAEMRRCFFANGGQVYLDRGLLYGQAFDMMRRDKIAALKKLSIPKDEPLWSRCEKFPTDVKVYVAGANTDDLRLRRAFANEDAIKRKSAEAWMNDN